VRALDKEILRLALPSILANLTVPLVGMVDIAIAGHLDTSAAALIGGISVGALMFDMLYWNFGFLRAGTGGMTAQAY
jgi:MATE family multidrug resistance protein